MADLLKEAIADAKAVRETAIANAKIALEEAFTPKLQSMLSAKINEQEELDLEDELEDEETSDLEIDAAIDSAEELEGEDEGDEDLELESIIKELEGDEEEDEDDIEEGTTPAVSSGLGGGENKKPNDNSGATKDPEGTGSPISNDKAIEGSDLLEQFDDTEEDDEDEEDDVTIDEVLKSLREQDEEDDEEEENGEAVAEARYVAKAYEGKLREAYGAISFLKGKINEVNLLNAKLLFSNKLFRAGNLNESQKLRVIETFDRAKNLREIKLVYSTLAESFKNTTKKVIAQRTRKPITENFASTPTRTTKPRNVLTEGHVQAARFQKLAGLK